MCSEHFINSKGRILIRDEVPTLKLPSWLQQFCFHQRGSHLESALTDLWEHLGHLHVHRVVSTLKQELTVLEQNLEMSRFRLASIASDDQNVTTYTGFPSYKALVACFKFLGPGVHSLVYWVKQQD